MESNDPSKLDIQVCFKGKQSPVRDTINVEESKRAAQSVVLQRVAQSITKSCTKRENGDCIFVIKKGAVINSKRTASNSNVKFSSMETEAKKGLA